MFAVVMWEGSPCNSLCVLTRQLTSQNKQALRVSDCYEAKKNFYLVSCNVRSYVQWNRPTSTVVAHQSTVVRD